MPHLERYSKLMLLMESEMTFYELMHETQPPKALDAKALRWKLGGGWVGWLERLLAKLGDNADYHRKV